MPMSIQGRQKRRVLKVLVLSMSMSRSIQGLQKLATEKL